MSINFKPGSRSPQSPQVKRTGVIPPEHVSHDHLNEQKDIPIDDVIYQKWKVQFERIAQQHHEKGEQVKWVIVDGFLLYWHPVRRLLGPYPAKR